MTMMMIKTMRRIPLTISIMMMMMMTNNDIPLLSSTSTSSIFFALGWSLFPLSSIPSPYRRRQRQVLRTCMKRKRLSSSLSLSLSELFRIKQERNNHEHEEEDEEEIYQTTNQIHVIKQMMGRCRGGGDENQNEKPDHHHHHQQQQQQQQQGEMNTGTVTSMKNYSNQAVSLFSNVRIPAALFAGASAGAAFAMPVGNMNGINGIEGGIKIGLIKRIYALLMMNALSSEIVAVVVSTLAVSHISNPFAISTSTMTNHDQRQQQQQQQEEEEDISISSSSSSSSPPRSVGEFLERYYALEWASVRWHFIIGVLSFIVAIGLRAWISINCPAMARAALGTIASTTCLCFAFIYELEGKYYSSFSHIPQNNDTTNEEKKSNSFVISFWNGWFQLPLSYIKLLYQRAARKKQPLFAMALFLSIMTGIYIIYEIPIILNYLSSTP